MIQKFENFINEAKEINLDAVYQDLKRKIGSDLKIEDESKTEISAEIRYWGDWESDPQEEEEEDDDQEILTSNSRKQLNKIISELEKEHKKVKFSWTTGEKNWIYFTISKK
jgi:hypothetical protein